GLHSKDTFKLIQVLRKLQELGNTVVVVEHDEDIMRAADYIIDVGPGAGIHGGQIVYQGDMSKLTKNSTSHTVRYLMHEEKIPVPSIRRSWNSYIQVKGARANNLKGVDVKLPLHAMTVVTGVSGSGKSTLVHDIFYLGLRRELGEGGDRPGYYVSMTGDVKMITKVEYIDQNPIGKSSRSNAATYLKIWDEIRKLYATQPLAKQMGMSAKFFSFNSDGGRCEECKGEGVTHVEMQFMADLTLTCESCKGKRFKKDTLEVTFQEKSVYDLLEMSVEEASLFFSKHKQEKIVKSLQPLLDVGLGYIKLGQTSTTLSGGENQRVKLAYYLSLERVSNTLFIFDEPTTGLHFHDIHILLQAFEKLIDRGHTILIIEHNLDVVKCADHVIDIGPDGGARGGQIVAVGTPEEIAECQTSFTGQFLKEKLK
ncbi:MAG TPA: excinuclease ABC subunit A, partial [Bacteroidaceae bacterium]|nr:excinuclease ABC subunit A [Bacteroidaceae bacterium]